MPVTAMNLSAVGLGRCWTTSMWQQRQCPARSLVHHVQVAHKAGVPADALEAASACFRDRAQAQSRALQAAVTSGPLRAASEAAHVAQSLGLDSEVADARAALTRRLHATSEAATSQLQALLYHLRPNARPDTPATSCNSTAERCGAPTACSAWQRSALETLSIWARACLQPQRGASALQEGPLLTAEPQPTADAAHTAHASSASTAYQSVARMTRLAHAAQDAAGLSLTCLATAMLELLHVAAQWQLARHTPFGAQADVLLDYDGYVLRVGSTGATYGAAQLLATQLDGHLVSARRAGTLVAGTPQGSVAEPQLQDPVLAMWRHVTSQDSAHVLPGARLWSPESVLAAAMHAARRLLSQPIEPPRRSRAPLGDAVPAAQQNSQGVDLTADAGSTAAPLNAQLLCACAGSDKLADLPCLSLAFEGLASIDAISSYCRSLHTLNLAANCLRSLDALRPLSASLRSLDVSENGLRGLSAVSALSKLQHLNADRNSLKSLAGAQHCSGRVHVPRVRVMCPRYVCGAYTDAVRQVDMECRSRSPPAPESSECCAQ